MKTKLVPLIIGGIVVVFVLGFIVFKFFIGQKFSLPQPTQVSESEPVASSRLIKGIGFKNGAWAKYRLERWGVSFIGGARKEQISEMLVKTLGFKVNNEELLGIELNTDVGNALLLFEKEGKNQKYALVKDKEGKNVFCFNTLPSEYGGGFYQEFKKDNLEKQYEVDETYVFIGKEKIKLESGKEIEILKYERQAPISVGGQEYQGQELWVSGEVPTYFVYFVEKYRKGGEDKLGPTAKLIDFGLEGATSVFTQVDLEKCKLGAQESSPLGSTLPAEVNKFTCQTDADCACGVDKETGQCAFGNKAYIDTSKQCPDFCSGIGGQFQIKCVSGICQPLIKPPF